MLSLRNLVVALVLVACASALDSKHHQTPKEKCEAQTATTQQGTEKGVWDAAKSVCKLVTIDSETDTTKKGNAVTKEDIAKASMKKFPQRYGGFQNGGIQTGGNGARQEEAGNDLVAKSKEVRFAVPSSSPSRWFTGCKLAQRAPHPAHGKCVRPDLRVNRPLPISLAHSPTPAAHYDTPHATQMAKSFNKDNIMKRIQARAAKMKKEDPTKADKMSEWASRKTSITSAISTTTSTETKVAVKDNAINEKAYVQP